MLLLSIPCKLLSMYLGCRFYPFMYVEFFRILLERSGLHLFPCTINCQTRVLLCAAMYEAFFLVSCLCATEGARHKPHAATGAARLVVLLHVVWTQRRATDAAGAV